MVSSTHHQAPGLPSPIFLTCKKFPVPNPWDCLLKAVFQLIFQSLHLKQPYVLMQVQSLPYSKVTNLVFFGGHILSLQAKLKIRAEVSGFFPLFCPGWLSEQEASCCLCITNTKTENLPTHVLQDDFTQRLAKELHSLHLHSSVLECHQSNSAGGLQNSWHKAFFVKGKAQGGLQIGSSIKKSTLSALRLHFGSIQHTTDALLHSRKNDN